MDFKVMTAVLLCLFVLGVGMRSYDLDVNDLTDYKNFTSKIGGEDFEGFDFSSGRDSVETDVKFDMVSDGNSSDLNYRGNVRELVVEAESLQVDAGFSTQDSEVTVKNLSGRVKVEGDNVTVSGRTNYLNVGEREMSSDSMQSIDISTSSPERIRVRNVSSVNMDFDKVSGSAEFGGYSIELDNTEVGLEKFSGVYELVFDESRYVLGGSVKDGWIGREGSRISIG